MGAYRFVTTRLRGLHAAGRADDLQHALISALLARHLGPEYSGLFAEFEVRDNDTRDWFVEALPAPVPIASLPEDDQSAIRSRADQMIAAVRDLAARIETQGAQGRNVARVLRDATTHPANDLWLYRGAPLIVNWGYQQDDVVPQDVTTISTFVPLPPAPPPRPAPAPPPKAPPKSRRIAPLAATALLWLIFATVIARLYGDLLPACGLKSPFAFFGPSIGNCPSTAMDDPSIREGVRLQRAIEQAELDIVERKQACSAPPRHAEIEQRLRARVGFASLDASRKFSPFAWRASASPDSAAQAEEN
jgi:hypothetical protein